jgi:hypothetical protein
VTTLKEIRDNMRAEEYQTKLAAVAEAYDGDEERLGLLGEAIDLVKAAEAQGEIDPTDESTMLTMAVQIVEDHVKEASAEDEEGEELDKEAAAQVEDMAYVVGNILAERGITQEDLDKVASADEMKQIGEYCACVLIDELNVAEGAE